MNDGLVMEEKATKGQVIGTGEVVFNCRYLCICMSVGNEEPVGNAGLKTIARTWGSGCRVLSSKETG